MTKRTAEQTLRDEIARAERGVEKTDGVYRDAIAKVKEAEAARDAAYEALRSADTKLERSKRALEALLGTLLLPVDDPETNVDELPTEADLAVFAGVTGAIDPALSDALDSGVEYEREPDREELIAAATGTDVEVVRKASRRAPSTA